MSPFKGKPRRRAPRWIVRPGAGASSPSGRSRDPFFVDAFHAGEMGQKPETKLPWKQRDDISAQFPSKIMAAAGTGEREKEKERAGRCTVFFFFCFLLLLGSLSGLCFRRAMHGNRNSRADVVACLDAC